MSLVHCGTTEDHAVIETWTMDMTSGQCPLLELSGRLNVAIDASTSDAVQSLYVAISRMTM